MKEKEIYTLEEILDESFGVIGTPKRDEFERKSEERHNKFLMGQAIRDNRIKRSLSQEQLGEKMGIKKSQICRLEKGNALSWTSFYRAMSALGIEKATIDFKTGEIVCG